MEEHNKNTTQKPTLCNTDVSSVFVARSTQKQLFIEQFEHESVNFTQKELGKLLGFFIIRHETPESENIVNFLISELKQRYFDAIEKSPEIKLELALHRVNRALEELAKIGNVDWLGNIESAVCAINETELHFSVTGNAQILLLRKNILTNISEGLSSTTATINPLKTFTDTASGPILPDDKIIITSQELLNFVSLSELQKNACRMGTQNFIQFIKTVLKNECSLASTIIIDVSSKKIVTPTISNSDNFTIKNAFSADLFQHKQSNEQIKDGDLQENDSNTEKETKEYVDPQTGIIYIKQDEENISFEKESSIDTFKTSFADFLENNKKITTKKFNFLSKKIKKTISNHQNKKFNPEKKETETQKKSHQQKQPIHDQNKAIENTQQKIDENINLSILAITFLKKSIQICKKYIIILQQNIILHIKKIKSLKDKSHAINQKSSLNNRHKNQSLIPNINRIKILWKSLSHTTRFIVLGMIAIIIITPLIISHFIHRQKSEPTITTNQNPVSTPIISKTENNTQKKYQENKAMEIFTASNITAVTLLNKIPIWTTKTKLVLFDNNDKKEINMPTNSGNITHIAPMHDLKLLFILTDKNNLYSFSPSTKKIQKQTNNPFASEKTIYGFSSFMTYLYAVTNDKILRYARIDSGFDIGESWLNKASSIDFSTSTDIAINNDIFIANNQKIFKFAKHKQQTFHQQDTISSVDLIYSNADDQYLWIIDKKNKTLFQIHADSGSMQNKFTDNSILNAISFAIDEQQNTALIATNEKIFKMNLLQY